ncbi:hypothetical protein JTB14_004751 [Gonioctena quinquepunctata]|nr:hypothetical protein JTB14_004751 [Gonioctena quinquepunctata]
MDKNQAQGEGYLPLGQSSGETKGIDFSNKVGDCRDRVGNNRSRDQTDSWSKDRTYEMNYCSGNQPLNSSRRISEILGGKSWQTLSETPREVSQNNTTITLESEQRIPVNRYSSYPQESSPVSGPDQNSRNQWRPSNEVRSTEYFQDRRVTFAGVDGEPRRTQNENGPLRDLNRDDPISRPAEVLLRNMGNQGPKKIDRQRLTNFSGLDTEDPIAFIDKMVHELSKCEIPSENSVAGRGPNMGE